MGAKRRSQLKREGRMDFVPLYEPRPTRNGRCLEGYDKACYLEGWGQAQGEYESEVRRLKEQELKGGEGEYDYSY